MSYLCEKIFYFVLRPIYGTRLHQSLANSLERTNHKLANRLFEKKLDLRAVYEGPFQGMRYPHLKACGSALIPKLLGSYEKELHPVVNEIIERKYDVIIDVGCAEGYYAVGFALRCPESTIYAYDIDPEARRLTLEMAELNGVSTKMHIEAACDAGALVSHVGVRPRLIVSDCEGYEEKLLSGPFLDVADRFDILVETHDSFEDPQLTQKLIERFSSSHTIQQIPVIPRQICDFPLGLRSKAFPSLRNDYLYEGRPYSQKWLWMQAKS